MIYAKHCTLLALLCCSFFALKTDAQRLPFALDVPLNGVTSFNPDIPTPESVIGHVIGSRHTLPYQVEAYFKAVAASSNRVVVNEHARSYEGRSLFHAIITSPANHSNLETVKNNQHLLSDSPSEVSDELLASMPVVLYQGYSVHGNEASGTEAAILYLYYLAAGIGPALDEALQDAIVILDPMLNPDGRDRFGDWVNGNRGAVATLDSQDREHNEPWPRGRTNHYWFDLNRDWMVSQHPESQGRLKVFHEWRPQILTDHHEMGGNSTFFFQPGIPSRKNPNTPDRNLRLTEAIAAFHAEGLDEIGSAYYSEESFDDFFYGKGSAYPDINGAVGILFEQASSRALRFDASDGELHYAFTVRNQFVTSLTTLKAGVSLRLALLKYQRDFYAESLDMGNKSKKTAWILDLEKGRTRAQLFAQLLQRHRVEFYELKSDVIAGGVTVSAGNGYVIPADQPQYRLIESFTERTLQYEDSLFYDVSTWTLPLAFDVDLLPTTLETDSFKGELIESVRLDGGKLEGGRAKYAYLLKWDRFFAPRALRRFFEAGIHVRLAGQPFSALIDGEKTWLESGTIIIPVTGRNTSGPSGDPEKIHLVVEEAVENDFVNILSVQTGLTPDGPDLGGRSTTLLRAPRIAIAAGVGVSSGQAGEAWHALSERFGMSVSLIEPSKIAKLDLSRYNTIILPGGSYAEDATGAITSWTRSGGTVIILSGATAWANKNDLISVEKLNVDMDSLMQGLDYDQIDEARGAQAIGGSIFEIGLDTSHPIAYGLPEKLPVFHTGSSLYSYEGSAGGLVGSYSDEPLLSGYLSREKKELLPGAASVIAVRYGSGHVVSFMERLNFRAYWLGTQRLFFNAVFFGSYF